MTDDLAAFLDAVEARVLPRAYHLGGSSYEVLAVTKAGGDAMNDETAALVTRLQALSFAADANNGYRTISPGAFADLRAATRALEDLTRDRDKWKAAWQGSDRAWAADRRRLRPSLARLKAERDDLARENERLRAALEADRPLGLMLEAVHNVEAERDDYAQRLAATAESWRLLSIERDNLRAENACLRRERDLATAKVRAEDRSD